jgi:aminobenzoyl-glutamate utilization protein B
VQTKETKYEPLMRPNEKPATFLNADILDRFRPQMRRFYYDPTKYATYLEQLGIQYPTLRKSKEKCEDTPTVP